ncbi:meiosis-specific nuclear structural protein 1-like [Diachasmimorpha longicaudata]|uniref:meiosis-specific nuclear structural protein 1-like n=1 Tax=Diachasmimorpha longicaudata TaxID=58733 RepID=UPI0030B8B07F
MSGKSLEKLHYRDCNRESVEELANLEAQFRNAYVLKALEAQIAEKEADRIAQEARDKLSKRVLTLHDEKTIEEEVARKNAASKNREDYKLILEEQMESKILEKLCQEDIDKRERQILIEVDRIIDEEYECTRVMRRNQLAETLRRERLIFEEMREIKRTKEIEIEAIAVEKQQKYLDEVEERSVNMRKLREDQQRKRDAVIETVAKLFVDTGARKRERESVIYELISQTIRQELLIAECEFKCRVRENKRQLAEDLKEQMIFLVESEAQSRERDRVFADDVMAKIMVDERVSILTAEARRRKQMIYKKDLEELIDERRRLRDVAVAALKAEWEVERANEEIRRMKIKEERQRLIDEHLGQVSTHLRKGVLSKEEEDQFLSQKS